MTRVCWFVRSHVFPIYPKKYKSDFVKFGVSFFRIAKALSSRWLLRGQGQTQGQNRLRLSLPYACHVRSSFTTLTITHSSVAVLGRSRGYNCTPDLDFAPLPLPVWRTTKICDRDYDHSSSCMVGIDSLYRMTIKAWEVGSISPEFCWARTATIQPVLLHPFTSWAWKHNLSTDLPQS